MIIKRVKSNANKVMEDRTSIRKYDPDVKISREELSDILQDAMTAPSSLNLQPWRFVVIDSEEGKEMAKPLMMFNQAQAETSSAIIAIFGDMHNMENADKILTANVEHNLMTVENKDKMLSFITSHRAKLKEEQVKNSVFFDCGLVAMQIMLSAKSYGYDTCPIGGYMKEELTEALGLDSKRYVPVLIISIGKAMEDSHDSVRFSVADITQWK